MAASSMMMSNWLRAPGNRTPLLICLFSCSINVILKIQPSDSSCTRYYFSGGYLFNRSSALLTTSGC